MKKPDEAAKSRDVSSHALEVSQSSHCAVVRLNHPSLQRGSLAGANDQIDRRCKGDEKSRSANHGS